jgi:hypothetical protein
LEEEDGAAREETDRERERERERERVRGRDVGGERGRYQRRRWVHVQHLPLDAREKHILYAENTFYIVVPATAVGACAALRCSRSLLLV